MLQVFLNVLQLDFLFNVKILIITFPNVKVLDILSHQGDAS